MRQRIRSHLTYANVIATLALFLVLSGGTAVALNGSNTVFSDDIVDGQVKSADIVNGAVTPAKVANFQLNDEDVGQGTFVNFTGNIGTIPAQNCVERDVGGVNAQGDHLLLTPNFNTQSPLLVYSAEYHDSAERMDIQVCNPTTSAINDGDTNFNLLVIDAQ
jgi:hypothetical protein